MKKILIVNLLSFSFSTISQNIIPQNTNYYYADGDVFYYWQDDIGANQP